MAAIDIARLPPDAGNLLQLQCNGRLRKSSIGAPILSQLVSINARFTAMVKHVKGAKSVPALPLRRPLAFELGHSGSSGRVSLAFPQDHRLIVTTSQGVYTWDLNGVTEIFHSSSKGIVAAKRLASDGKMLAVADSQVVVLHDFEGETQKSYRLKGSEGRVRLLRFAKESNNLFFTTSLRNSVQSYSLKDSKLHDTSHNHPTPPAVFAISCNSQFLLSTSAAPPTIHLTDLSLHMLPILVRPECSSSAVVAAASHPEQANYFVLAFADGTAAVLDVTHFFRKHDKKEHETRAAVSGAGGVLAFIKGLHAQGTCTGKEALGNGITNNGVDQGTGIVGIGERSCGITAIAFVPGRKATVITVGYDGKCCVVDFTQDSKKKAVLLKTWHLRRPAMTVSVVCSWRIKLLRQADGAQDGAPASPHGHPNGAYYIAIGREDGRVLLYDLDGTPLGEQIFNNNGLPVIDVEWTQAESSDIATRRRNSIPAIAISSSAAIDRQASEIAVSNHASSAQTELSPSHHRKLFNAAPVQDTLEVSQLDHLPNEPTEAANYLDLVQPTTASSEGTSTGNATQQSSDLAPTTPSDKTVHRKTVLNSIEKPWQILSNESPVAESTPPPIPPRPSPRPGGLLSMRRAQSSHESPADNSYSNLIANARRANTTRPMRTSRPLGPRPMRSLEGDGSTSRTTSSHDQVSSSHSEIEWSNVAPTPPPHGPQTQIGSPTASIESFQTASSQVVPSERSSDTVIDWDVGSPRQPFPSLEDEPRGPAQDDAPMRPKQKGHISLSISSVSRDTSVSPSSVDNETVSPIIQWPAESPRYSAPGLHATTRPTESPAKSKTNNKDHVSIPPAASDSTFTQPSTASSGPIVQWPSLKKSPRIPELNKALSFSSRKSATGSVLETYTTNPSTPRKVNTSFSRAAVDKDAAGSQSQSSMTSSARIESALNASLASFRTEVALKFEEQRVWLEGLIRSEDEGRVALEEENRWLRDELARVEGVKEKERSSDES